jgi:translation initiation factor IF-1
MTKTGVKRLWWSGTVIEAMPSTTFWVQRSITTTPLLAYLSGRLRKYYIRILLGDRVKVQSCRRTT